MQFEPKPKANDKTVISHGRNTTVVDKLLIVLKKK